MGCQGSAMLAGFCGWPFPMCRAVAGVTTLLGTWTSLPAGPCCPGRVSRLSFTSPHSAAAPEPSQGLCPQSSPLWRQDRHFLQALPKATGLPRPPAMSSGTWTQLQVPTSLLPAAGSPVPDTTVTCRTLLSFVGPPAALLCLGTIPSSTQDSPQQARSWLDRLGGTHTSFLGSPTPCPQSICLSPMRKLINLALD